MKEKNPHIDDDLLIRYLAEETTEAEGAAVKSWLAESESHQRMLAAYRILFEESKALKPGVFGDEDKAWERFRQHIGEQEDVERPVYPIRRWLAIAASILILLAVGTWFYQRSVATIHLYANDQPLVDSLSDGSLISLNKNSSLSFKPGKIREVTLTGEAFFDVKHDIARPFQIRVNDILINVLGTSFNVKTIGNQTEILVRSGIVSVSGENQNMQLQTGEQVLTTPGRHWQKQAQANFNINLYPGLVQTLLKDPKKWASLLKNFTVNADTSSQAFKNKALVRSIIGQLVSEGIVKPGSLPTFHLNGTGFIINGVLEPDAVFRRYKAKYLPSDDFTIALGTEPIKGKGIFVPRSTF
ncbi:MAG: FecR domain-containing protein [Bacteroidota bacterium]